MEHTPRSAEESKKTTPSAITSSTASEKTAEIIGTPGCSFHPIQLDPRPGVKNPEIGFGVEVTIAGYEHIQNLDHHGAQDTAETPSAAEQAMICPLPAHGINIGTVRIDTDSLTAMAVLHLRMQGVAYDQELVSLVGAIDRLSPSRVPTRSRKYSAICGITYGKQSLENKILCIAKILAGEVGEEEIENIATTYETENQKALEDARANLQVRVTETPTRIALIEGNHRFATKLGYELAPVVIAKNPMMPVSFTDPGQGTYIKYTICRYDSNVTCQIEKILAELQAIEPGWGGRADIIGSPQGTSSKLTTEDILAIVQKHTLSQSSDDREFSRKQEITSSKELKPITDAEIKISENGDLDLSRLTSAEGLKLPEWIEWDLNLSGLTSAKGLKLPKEIEWDLNLSGLTSAKGLKLPNIVNWCLDLSGLTSAKGLKLPKEIEWDLDLLVASTEGLKLPEEIGWYLRISGPTSIRGLKLPKNIRGNIFLPSLTSAEGLEFPKETRSIFLSDLTSAEGLKLPSVVYGDLDLSQLKSAEGLKLPKEIEWDLFLSNLTSAEGLKLPSAVYGDLDLSQLKSAKGLKLPKVIRWKLYLRIETPLKKKKK